MRFDDGFANGEAQSRPARLAIPGLVDSSKAVKDVWQIRGRDAGAVVGNCNRRHLRISGSFQPDESAG